jgi:hypothetical protein
MDLANRGPLGPRKPKPERGTARAKDHLARVKALPCVICHQPGPSDAHHVFCGATATARPATLRRSHFARTATKGRTAFTPQRRLGSRSMATTSIFFRSWMTCWPVNSIGEVMPYVHRCNLCGAESAPFGFRWPGPVSALEGKKRAYLWACEACKGAAEARWKGAAAGPISQPESPRADAAQPQRQGSLGL